MLLLSQEQINIIYHLLYPNALYCTKQQQEKLKKEVIFPGKGHDEKGKQTHTHPEQGGSEHRVSAASTGQVS